MFLLTVTVSPNWLHKTTTRRFNLKLVVKLSRITFIPTECKLSSAEMAILDGKTGSGGTIICSVTDFVWTMLLTCENGKEWSDTALQQRQEQCSCHAGKWQTISSKCLPSTTGKHIFCVFN